MHTAHQEEQFVLPQRQPNVAKINAGNGHQIRLLTSWMNFGWKSFLLIRFM